MERKIKGDRFGLALALPQQQLLPHRNEHENKFREIMKASGIIKINGIDYRTEMKDLEDLGELGDGTSGHVVKMRHLTSGEVIAVKQMRRTGNAEENKRIVNDIETALKAQSCQYIVQCLGFIITSADVWICMELMATCFDKLLKRSARPVPEDILGKVTVAVVKALSYLKDKDTMHRDVKPSNILVDERGVIKLCDFGISGQLNNSKAKTRSAGCVAYLAPERIDPKISEYDVRADVWSLGITLVELATGKFPYQGCATDFEVLTCVMQSLPPTLPADQGFSVEFQNFVKRCLIHDVNSRPKYVELLQLPFLVYYESKPVNVADWLVGAMKLAGLPLHQRDIILKNPIGSNGTVGAGGTAKTNTTPHTPTTNGNPVQILDTSTTTTTQSTTSNLAKYAPLPPRTMAKLSERNLFMETTTTTTTLTPTPIQIAPSSRISEVHHLSHVQPPNYHQPMPSIDLHHQQQQKGPVDSNKVYRKSPFLPRKKELSEGKPSLPKKESKLTSIGNSLLKNLTTSPFSQRKSMAGQQPVELPQSNALNDKRAIFQNNFESNGSPIPPVRHHFHNSPLLQRRNPSYVTYNEHPHHQMSPARGGRNSANTSPIVLQRFYHQQNQLREKGGGADDMQRGGISDYLECGLENTTTNPFINYNNTQSPKFHSKFNRDLPHQSLAPQPATDNYADVGESVGHRRPYRTSESGRISGIPIPSLPSAQEGYCGPQFSRSPHIAEPERRMVLNEDTLRHYAPAEGERVTVSSNGEGKVSEEKTLGWLNSFAGDVKRRFASYLKVNVNAHRQREVVDQRQPVDESSQTSKLYADEGLRLHHNPHYQGSGENGLTKPNVGPPLAFASTNPFLGAEDCGYLIGSDTRKVQYLNEKTTIERRHRSPDPPPRYNRGQSPLLLRKKLEMSNNWGGSPFLSRRIMSGSPPAPIRDCESVPGSPQHFRTRIHYTPEPQRRFYRHVE